MNIRLILTGVVAAAALAGCSGEDATEDAAPAASSTSSSTTTESGPSVAQVASVVVQQRSRIEELQTDLADCPSITDVVQAACSFVAGRAPVDGELTMKGLDEYRGETLPVEIADLFDETYVAAEALSQVDVTGCEDTSLNEECSGATYIAQARIDDLMAKLDGWGPYS